MHAGLLIWQCDRYFKERNAKVQWIRMTDVWVAHTHTHTCRGINSNCSCKREQQHNKRVRLLGRGVYLNRNGDQICSNLGNRGTAVCYRGSCTRSNRPRNSLFDAIYETLDFLRPAYFSVCLFTSGKPLS